ncbi:hypothetical protein JTE90_024269 [Oedothorax gibbosus]|uniref:RBR-type E3 ubiquitin transferase n=1 Tax=Oedothorax gibbosus TaxID=931172 RepID=A0AAV6VP46_9ARAC|nr:hypothetical protein JTE90_024269 [Oedothorax gibbosus]
MDSDDNILCDSDSKDEFGDDDDCFCFEAESDKLEYYEDFHYDILSTEDIVDEMLKLIKEVNTIVEIPPTITRIFLNHFNWDREKLYECYYGGDPESLFKEAHVVNPRSNVAKIEIKSFQKIELCEVCLRKLSCKMMTSLACGHRYCNECWKTYLSTKIMDEGEVQSISCFTLGCDILVDDQTIMELVDPTVKSKYQYLITNSFILCNRLMKHCPKPGCSRVIKVRHVAPRNITCSCGHTFCFQCSENGHEPISCQLLQKWNKKCKDDSASLNWIATNTKDCPKCSVRIEKNGGCNHMTCKNLNCKYEFCWLCSRSWTSHNFNWEKCNRYNEETIKSKELSQSDLQKYDFYYSCYMNHALYSTVEIKIAEMQQNNMTWNEAQFLKKAVDVLCECRQTLMYTYVFAYFLAKSNESAIFEGNQSDLQSAVEGLSEFLERELLMENITKIKQIIQDKSRYCDKRRRVLLNHVHEGYENDTWKDVDL